MATGERDDYGEPGCGGRGAKVDNSDLHVLAMRATRPVRVCEHSKRMTDDDPCAQTPGWGSLAGAANNEDGSHRGGEY